MDNISYNLSRLYEPIMIDFLPNFAILSDYANLLMP